ncbi:MAG: Crp/Fnr family transcriptional regulator [Roseburia sp.]
MDDKKKYLERLPYWAHLSANEKKLVEDHSALHTYARNGILHSYGTECLGMILLLSGELRTYILSEEGREITLFRLYEGDACVLSASCVIRQITFDPQMIADTDCTVLVVSSGIFSKLAEQNIYVRCYMFEVLSQRFSSVVWTMQQILFMGFDARLASFLVSEYDRTGTNEIEMTHEQIARHISSAREVVARMLKRFVERGLVDLKRGRILIKDIDGLRNLN